MSNQLDAKFVNQMICGDCVAGMRQLPDACIPLTVTSVPFDDLQGLAQPNYLRLVPELFRVTAEGGVVVCEAAEKVGEDGGETGSSSRLRLLFKRVGFLLYQTLIVAHISLPRPSPRRYMPAPRYVFVVSKGRPRTVNLIRDKPNVTAGQVCRGFAQRREDGSWKYGPMRTTPLFGRRSAVWTYRGGGWSTSDRIALIHPALMSEALAKDLILSYSRPGDLVFDPLAGVGTTCKMALLNDRRYLGMEIEGRYVEVAQQRLRLAEADRRSSAA